MTDETLKLRPWQQEDLAKAATDPQVKGVAWDVAVRTGMSVDDVTRVLERVRAGGYVVVFGPRAGRQALALATAQLMISGVPFPLAAAREVRPADVFPMLTIPRHIEDENRPWKPGDPRLPAFLRKRNERHQGAPRRSARKNRR